MCVHVSMCGSVSAVYSVRVRACMRVCVCTSVYMCVHMCTGVMEFVSMISHKLTRLTEDVRGARKACFESANCQ
jgi:hypothetical protein